MNNVELIKKVSENSGVNVNDCEKVLNALEAVLDDEFIKFKSVAEAFDKIYKLMTYFNKKGRVVMESIIVVNDFTKNYGIYLPLPDGLAFKGVY